MRIHWDPWKATVNLRKHGVSFLEAESVFSDDEAILLEDPIHSLEEERFVLLGLSDRLRLLVVCHTLRDDGRTIRIFSARRAIAKESDQYLERMKR